MTYTEIKNHNETLQCTSTLTTVLHIFLSIYCTKCPEDQILTGLGVLVMQKQ